MEVVFLTNFSDTCFRAIPSVAQMVDDLSVHLTILHAYDPDGRNSTEAEHWLRSFFPEADRYRRATRIATPGQPVDVFKEFIRNRPVDLVLCPGSDSLGLPRIGHLPLRGRIAHECGVPVWTIGRKVEGAKLGKPVRNVACWMEFDSDETVHLELAAEYAWKLGAKLHLIHTLPEIHEGMIYSSLTNRPLHADTIHEAFSKRLQAFPIEPLIHVHGGNGRKTRAALARAHDADILFTSVARSPLTDWVYSDYHSIDRCPCPVISISRGCEPRAWNLERGSSQLIPWPEHIRPRAIARAAQR